MNQLATVRSLQQRITSMQHARLDRGLPTPPSLRPLFPGGALRKGAPVAVQGSLQLSLALLSSASASGAWCGVIGVPHLGIGAAAQTGLALERLVLIPEPGKHALAIAGMLSEVLTVLVLNPERPPTSSEAERLNARLRDHGTALVVTNAWPRSDTALRVTASRWSGLGAGNGLLCTHELSVQSTDRRGQRTHTVRFRDGRLA